MIKPGEDVEILGLRDGIKTTVTGVEMFKKSLGQGQAGEWRAAGWDGHSHPGRKGGGEGRVGGKTAGVIKNAICINLSPLNWLVLT